jgi:hypothetical protein
MRSKTHPSIPWLSGLLALLLLVACSRGPSPDFSIALSPASLTVQQGSSGTTQLTLTPQHGFTGTVSLSLQNAPAGVDLSPTSVNVTASNPGPYPLTISVDSGVTEDTYNLTLQATGGSLSKSADLTLTVNVASGGGGGGPGTTWTVRNQGSTLYSITYGNNQFVAVGSSGTIRTSPDGVSWTVRTSGTNDALDALRVLYSITYGNNQFVAVGSSGTIRTSPDGVS